MVGGPVYTKVYMGCRRRVKWDSSGELGVKASAELAACHVVNADGGAWDISRARGCWRFRLLGFFWSVFFTLLIKAIFLMGITGLNKLSLRWGNC